jgi:hypothetical protein
MFQWFSANRGGGYKPIIIPFDPPAPILACSRLHASMGIPVGLETLRMIGRTFPGFHTQFPVVQLFPDHGKFFGSFHRIAR